MSGKWREKAGWHDRESQSFGGQTEERLVEHQTDFGFHSE